MKRRGLGGDRVLINSFNIGRCREGTGVGTEARRRTGTRCVSGR
jgi:hypothetical protein